MLFINGRASVDTLLAHDTSVQTDQRHHGGELYQTLRTPETFTVACFGTHPEAEPQKIEQYRFVFDAELDNPLDPLISLSNAYPPDDISDLVQTLRHLNWKTQKSQRVASVTLTSPNQTITISRSTSGKAPYREYLV